LGKFSQNVLGKKDKTATGISSCFQVSLLLSNVFNEHDLQCVAAGRIGLKRLSDSQKLFTIFRELFKTRYKGNLSKCCSCSITLLSFP